MVWEAQSKAHNAICRLQGVAGQWRSAVTKVWKEAALWAEAWRDAWMD